MDANEKAAFTEASASLNNILLYALCAKVFTDSEMEHIISEWKTVSVPVLAPMLPKIDKIAANQKAVLITDEVRKMVLDMIGYIKKTKKNA